MKSTPDIFQDHQALSTVATTMDRSFGFTGTDEIYALFEIDSLQDITRIIGYLPDNATCQLYRAMTGEQRACFLSVSIHAPWKRPAYDLLTVLNMRKTAEKDLENFLSPFDNAASGISDYIRKLKVGTSNLLKSKSENRLFQYLQGSTFREGGVFLSNLLQGAGGFFRIGDLYGSIIETSGFTSLDFVPPPQDGSIHITTIRTVTGLEAKEVHENSSGLRSFQKHLLGDVESIVQTSRPLAWNHSVLVLDFNSRQVQARSRNLFELYLQHEVSVVTPKTLLKEIFSSLMPGNGRHHPYPLYLDAMTSIAATHAFLGVQ